MADWLEKRLARRMANEAGPRDGEFSAFEEVAFRGAPPPGEAVAAPPPAVRAPSREERRREPLLRALAAKVLAAHAQNRLQTSYPLAVNLANHDAEETDRLMALGAVAALAGGEAARGREAAGELERLNAPGEALRRLAAHLAAPPALDRAVAAVEQARLGAHAYVVALVALARPSAAELAFLDYLAARLRLGREAADGLRRRYRR